MTGLLRCRAVPHWQPSLVLIGTLASVAAAPGADLGPFLLAPAVPGYAGLAWSVLRGPQSGRAVTVPLQGARREVAEARPV